MAGWAKSKDMRFRRFAHRRDFRCLGIAFLILGLLPIPLPQIDFHNIRHHDGSGEFCEFHDHLLVWHPDAGVSDDVAIWHCHWLLAGLNLADLEPVGDGPATHAHVPDPPHVACCDSPRLTSAADSTSIGWFASVPPALLRNTLFLEGFVPAPTPSPPEASSLALHVSLTLLLQRLAC